MKFFKNQRGDTIMEVLVCVAVLSFVLSTAFALASRSSQANQQAGERGESVNLSESQIEKLKAFISKSATPAIPGDGNFCIYEDQGDPADPTDNKMATVSVATPDDLDSYPADCKKGEFFNTYINKAGNTYTVHTRWNAVTGDGQDEATMVYRVYPDIASTQTGTTVLLACNAPNEYMNSFGGCEPCAPGYQNLLGGFSMAPCTGVPPTITVRVQKILSTDGTNSPTCADAQTLASGVGVRLETGATQLNDNSTATFSGLLFGTTYTASIPTMPANFAACPPSTKAQTTLGQGNYPASNHTVTLTIRAVCYDQPTPQTVWVPDPPYSDVIGWNNYYTVGARQSWLDTYANGGYNGTFQNYPLPGDIGPQIASGTGHIHVQTGGSGVKYFAGYIASSHHPGKGFYAVWNADYHSDPIYGPPYSHGWHQETVIVNVRTCPT